MDAVGELRILANDVKNDFGESNSGCVLLVNNESRSKVYCLTDSAVKYAVENFGYANIFRVNCIQTFESIIKSEGTFSTYVKLITEDYIYTRPSYYLSGGDFPDGLHVVVREDRRGNIIFESILNSIWDYRVRSMDQTFHACFNAEEFPDMPDSVVYMSETFAYCENLRKVPYIPNGVVNLFRAFEYSGIRSIDNLPDSVKIMDYAFRECSCLENIPTIPSSVESCDCIFDGCMSLTEPVCILNDKIKYNKLYLDNCIFIRNVKIGDKIYKREQMKLDKPDNIEEFFKVYGKAYGCTDRDLYLGPYHYYKSRLGGELCVEVDTYSKDYKYYPPILECVDDCYLRTMSRAFSGCYKMVKSPKIPNSVDDICGCFKNCVSLKSFGDFPSSLKDMNIAFFKCYSLEEIGSIPDSVVSYSSTFFGTYKLNKKYYEGYLNSEDDDFYLKANDGYSKNYEEYYKHLCKFPNNIELDEVIIGGYIYSLKSNGNGEYYWEVSYKDNVAVNEDLIFKELFEIPCKRFKED